MSQPTLQGVLPAHLMPFDSDLEIDERNLRRHVRDLVSIDGVSGVVTNGHAAEVSALTDEEQQRTLALVVDEVAGAVPVISGVFADGTAAAARRARTAEREGADALLIFPSSVGEQGSRLRPEMVRGHYADIADATRLPMIVFEYPVTSGLHIETDVLLSICTEVENVVAVKEWSNSITAYERNYRELKALDKPISVLTSFSAALAASLAIGADGILSGHGSLVADLHVEMFRASQAADLTKLRELAERMAPLARVFYADPMLDMHNRMKVACAMLGRIDAAHVRPPLRPLAAGEREAIQAAIAAAGLRRGDRAGAPAGVG